MKVSDDGILGELKIRFSSPSRSVNFGVSGVAFSGDLLESDPHTRLCFAFQALWTADFPASKRSTPAYLGRYIRAPPTSSCSFVHYAFSGVGGAAPALRSRSRNGVFHRRAAPPHSPVRAPPSARTCCSFLRPPGFALSGRSRQHCLWLSLRRELLHLRFVTVYIFSGRGLGLPCGDIGYLRRL